jgi:hypothetical protein
VEGYEARILSIRRAERFTKTGNAESAGMAHIALSNLKMIIAWKALYLHGPLLVRRGPPRQQRKSAFRVCQWAFSQIEQDEIKHSLVRVQRVVAEFGGEG